MANEKRHPRPNPTKPKPKYFYEGRRITPHKPGETFMLKGHIFKVTKITATGIEADYIST